MNLKNPPKIPMALGDGFNQSKRIEAHLKSNSMVQLS